MDAAHAMAPSARRRSRDRRRHRHPRQDRASCDQTRFAKLALSRSDHPIRSSSMQSDTEPSGATSRSLIEQAVAPEWIKRHRVPLTPGALAGAGIRLLTSVISPVRSRRAHVPPGSSEPEGRICRGGVEHRELGGCPGAERGAAPCPGRPAGLPPSSRSGAQWSGGDRYGALSPRQLGLASARRCSTWSAAASAPPPSWSVAARERAEAVYDGPCSRDSTAVRSCSVGISCRPR